VQAEGRVVEALEIAEPLLRDGNPHHPELVSAARKAEAQLADASINPELAQRVDRLRSDLAMLAALEQARLERSAVRENRFDLRRGGEAYAQAFRDYGIDVEALASGVAGASMRERTISLHLATALDDWAWLMRAEGKQKEAEHLLAVAREVDPDEWRNRLRAAVESGDRSRLEDLARKAPLDRLPAATLITLESNLRAQGLHRDAVELLTRAQPRYSGDFWINQDLGCALMSTHPGRMDEAVGYLRTAIALRPQSPGARVNLAYALRASGRLDEAIAEYQEAVRLKPDYGAARWNLGEALTDRGRPQEAIAQYQEAIRIHPKEGTYYHSLGDALEKAGQLDEAVAALEEAIRLSPDNPYVYTSLGFILLRKGRREEAILSTRKGLAIQEARVAKSPGDAGQRHHLTGMQCNVAINLRRRGEYGEAESLLLRAVETETQLLAESPTNRNYRDYLANIYVTLANVYSAVGKHSEAETASRNALTHRKQLAAEVPTNAEYRTRLANIHAQLAEVLIARKQHEEAEAHYTQAIEVLKQLVADSPRTPSYRFDLADVLHDHVLALQAQDKGAEAQAECASAMSLLKQLVAEFPSVDSYGKLLADCRKVWLSGFGLSVFVPANLDIQKNTAGLAFGPDRNGDGVKDLYVAGRFSDNVVVYDGKTGAFVEELVGPASGLKTPVWLLFGPNGDLFTSIMSPWNPSPGRSRYRVARGPEDQGRNQVHLEGQSGRQRRPARRTRNGVRPGRPLLCRLCQHQPDPPL
jgi:tetratricopeptide (TPR) repeat protein